jgi:hypothetical protein
MKGRRALPTLSGINWAKTPRQRLSQLLSLSFYGLKAIHPDPHCGLDPQSQ